MRNLLASAFVALLVSVAVSGAADKPPLHETHGISTAVLKRTSTASDAQRITALAKRVDALQIRLADTREIAKQARDEADDATDVTSCIDSGIWLATDPDSGYLVEGDGTESDAVIAATLNAECTDAGS